MKTFQWLVGKMTAKKQRRCRTCGHEIPIEAHPNERYCSPECRHDGKVFRRYLRRKEEQKNRPPQYCIKCKKPFLMATKGSRFYCPDCSKEIRREREKGYYKARMERNPDYLKKRFCPHCGVEVRNKNEEYCVRCRRKKLTFPGQG